LVKLPVNVGSTNIKPCAGRFRFSKRPTSSTSARLKSETENLSSISVRP
jgi:hypothetical protein